MNVTAEVVNSTSISVKWKHLTVCSHVNDLSVTFRVEYTPDFCGIAQNMDKVRRMIATTTEALLTGMSPYTNYCIKVAAMNEMTDVGPYSYPVTILTLEDGKNEA